MDPRSMKSPQGPTPAVVNKNQNSAPQAPGGSPVIDPVKRLGELEEVVLNNGESIDEMKRAVKELGQENEAMRRRIREVLDTEDPARPWTWKRITWGVLSGAGGLALSFWLRKKQPIINHAASASLGMMAFERIKPLKCVKHVGGALTGLSSRWAHENFEALEIGMAGAAYAYGAFHLGEQSVGGFKAGVKAGGDAFQKMKARVLKARNSSKATEEEGDSHASD